MRYLPANYIAGAQLACKMWWADNHTAYSPETLANVLHRLQRAAIRDALNLEKTQRYNVREDNSEQLP